MQYTRPENSNGLVEAANAWMHECMKQKIYGTVRAFEDFYIVYYIYPR